MTILFGTEEIIQLFIDINHFIDEKKRIYSFLADKITLHRVNFADVFLNSNH
jgi:hypothetical protein